MKLALHPVILGGGLSLKEQFELAARHGYEGAEAGMDAIEALIAERSLAGAREWFAELGVQPASWGLPVDWRAPQERFREGIAVLAKQAALAESVGCTRCCTWIPPSTDDDPSELRALAVARFGECARVLADHGCRLGLEWVGPKTCRGAKHDFIFRMDQLLEMEDEIGEPNLGLLVDSFHWFTAGHTVEELAALPASEVVHVHINDAPDKPRDEQMDMERLLPGEGVIDLVGFVGALRRIGYGDYLSTETFSKELPTLPPDESAARAMAGWRKVTGA